MNETIKILFISEDPKLSEQVKIYERKVETLRFFIHPIPLSIEKLTDFYKSCDLLIFPAENMNFLLKSEEIADNPVPLILYGPGHLLKNGFVLGCDDFLRTPWDFDELLARVTKISVNLREIIFTFNDIPLYLSGSSLYFGDKKTDLVFHEQIILKTLAAHPGKPIGRKVLEFRLWGELKTNSRATDVHISNLRKKIRSIIGEPSMENPIKSVSGIGYFLDAISPS